MMRAVVQRVQGCTVSVEGSVRGRIERGALVYLGVARDDADKDVEYLVDKVANLRIFPDDNGTMNRSVLETGGEVCVVSQFTLCGDARKGRRPSWDAAAAPEQARELYESVCSGLETAGLSVKRGVFQAHMAVAYTNDGPVTILLDSRKLF